MDLLAELRNGPAEVFIALGIALLIGGVVKGGFSLFGLMDIGKLSDSQSKWFIAIGVVFMVIGGVIKLWDPNHKPLANDDPYTEVNLGKPLSLPVLTNDTDPDPGDADNFKITVGDWKPEVGSAESRDGKTIVYHPKLGFTGDVEIDYEVTDGNKGVDKAKVRLTLNAPKKETTPIVTVKAKLIDVFGDGISGNHKAIVGDRTIEFTSLSDGQFELTGPVKNVATIPFEYVAEYANPLLLDLKESDTIPILEHDPIQDIRFSFCKDYDKKKRLALEVFEDEYRIPFLELEEFIGDDSIKWGKLYCGVKYFGPDKEAVPYVFRDVDRTLPIEVEKKRADGSYFPIWKHELAAGTSTPGWNSNFNLNLLKGEYKVTFYSHRGRQIKSQEFEIE